MGAFKDKAIDELNSQQEAKKELTQEQEEASNKKAKNKP